MSLNGLNGIDRLEAERSEKITATCMLCPNAGVRAAMRVFGNGVICDRCAEALDRAIKELNARRFATDRRRAQPPIVEPLCVRRQERSWRPYAEFLAMAFILATIVAVFVISGD